MRLTVFNMINVILIVFVTDLTVGVIHIWHWFGNLTIVSSIHITVSLSTGQ
jgi:hypothetical protein